jgi:peptidoglycan hydrolase-like protein with peptidoglycan-binding domain
MPATIKKGQSGADVKTWQDALAGAGFPTTDPPGTFGDSTDQQTRAWQASKGLTVDGVVGPASWGAMTGVAQAGKTDPNAQYGRDAFLQAWPDILAEAATSQYPEVVALGAQGGPTLPELQIIGGNARLESGYGKGSYKLLDHATGQVLATSGNIFNFGAVQGGDPAQGTGFLATDTSPLKVTADNPHGYYDHSYRKYASAAEGAKAMIREMTIRRPTSWALMKAGDIDAWAQAMHAGIDANGKLKKDPITGVFGYFEQNPAQRAKSVASYAADIAFTLNEPLAAKQGGPIPPGGIVPSGDEGGGMTWGEDAGDIVTKVGLFAAIGGLGLAGWRLATGRWPWPGNWPRLPF